MIENIKEYAELIDETLVSLADACKKFPVPMSRASLERFWRYGMRGVRLRTVRIGSRRFTSLEEIRRFIEQTQNSGDEATPQRPLKPSMTKAELEAARKRFNLPAPGRNGIPAQS